MPQISLVPQAAVDGIWSSVTQGFDRSVRKTGGDLTPGDLWQQCRRGDAFLILAHDEKVLGASIWRPEIWQSGTKFRCMALYGTGISEWIEDMRLMAQKIGKDCGATSLLAEGREGWAKIFPNAKRLRVLYEEAI